MKDFLVPPEPIEFPPILGKMQGQRIFPLDNTEYTVYSVFNRSRGEVEPMKQWTFRMSEELMEWLREKAARETIRQKKSVSMNTVAVEILTKAMKADKKKGGK
jgi:glutamyl-tRNA reductase